MYPAKEIPKHGHKANWMMTGNEINHKFTKETFPIDESLMELDDLITKIIHNGKEQEMIKLLREYLQNMDSKRYY